MQENKECFVTRNWLSASTFRSILTAIYIGELALTLDNFIDIWQMDLMVEECEKYVLKVLSEKKFLTTWEVAKQLQNKNIMDKCEEFALKSFVC